MTARGAGAVPMGRLEAFSDGVFAIAITLLVLDLKPEQHEGESLARALGHAWPSYFAYLVSFAVIGIIWVNHHVLCSSAARADRGVLFANLFLLLTVSVIPFPTRVLAEHLTDSGPDAHTAAALYSAAMLVMGIAFTTLFASIVRDARLLHTPVPADAVRAASRRFSGGAVVYLLALGLSFVSAIAALALNGALGIYYCFDHLAPIRSVDDSVDDSAAE